MTRRGRPPKSYHGGPSVLSAYCQKCAAETLNGTMVDCRVPLQSGVAIAIPLYLCEQCRRVLETRRNNDRQGV